MSEPFLAEVRIFGFNFPPRGYAFCDGQLLPINQNQSLYSLLGTTYGGDGRTSFALPDMRGRIPFHVGSTPFSLGKKLGKETVALGTTDIPGHSHDVQSASQKGDSLSPVGHWPAVSPTGDLQYRSGTANSSNSTPSSGTGAAHNNMPPYLALNFCIALTGLFPSRS